MLRAVEVTNSLQRRLRMPFAVKVTNFFVQ